MSYGIVMDEYGRSPGMEALEDVRFLKEMSRKLHEDIFGGGPEERVRLLRESILGRDAAPANRIKGLLEVIEERRWSPG